jgi:replicative DNA helicase Mcm
MDTIKDALVLQLFGGVAKDTPGSHSRGDIHILLIGDPGTGKSQLLRYISKIAPRGIFTSGKSASAAGLTATAVKDELDGRWTIEGGALVLADRGIACIDEIDKMREDDRVAIHEAMEQQSISFAKAGITATLMTRCSLLAAANPKEGRFTDDKSYPEQINLLPTLLSRFDLIFPIIDRPQEDKDYRLASQILDSHRAGEMRRNIEENKDVDYDLEEAEGIMRSEPPIPVELMQKYIAYAKRNIYPVIIDDVKERLLNYYVNQRMAGKAKGDEEEEIERIALTPRQLEGLIRLSEASAKLRLSSIVEMEDCQRAIDLFSEYLERVARDKTGRLDIDTIMSGVSARKRSFGKIMRTTIQEITRNPDIDTAQGVHASDIKREAVTAGIPDDEIDDLISKLLSSGEIFSPTHDYYRLTK